MKRLFTVMLALIMVLSLSACSAKEEEKAPAGSTQNSQQSGTAPAVEKAGFNLLEADPEKRVSDLSITALKTDKKSYASGEKINCTLQWTGTPDSSAWVGIVPAAVPHGEEEVNDNDDLEYIYLADHEGDVFTFTVALEPGDYSIRVNESDSGGPELAWCAFSVK